jgi:quinolinate synthase
MKEWAMILADTKILIEEISDLKRERNALILAHNYQLAEVQDIAGFVGDSLELSQIAANSSAKVIVFCGVRFMVEVASILCPGKTVLLPDMNSGCLLADMITVDLLRQKKKENPNAYVVCYINSTAEAKAESDICCTSANAVQVVKSLPGDDILFVPDQCLGHYVSTKVDKHVVLWPGYCPPHIRIRPEDILRLKRKYPEANVAVHPECSPEVIALADEVMGTGGIVNYARREEVRELIVGTEIGIIHRLKKDNPNKRFIPASEQAICNDMKLITLEKVFLSLRDMQPQVKVADEIRDKAGAPIDRMMAMLSRDSIRDDILASRKQM